MRYKHKTLIDEDSSLYEDIHSQRENRLIIERIQQRNWEEAGRNWKKYLSNIQWDDTPTLQRDTEKQSEKITNPFW